MAQGAPRAATERLPPGPGWRWLWSLASPHVPALAVASGLVVAGSAVGLVAPRVAGMAVDAALFEESTAPLDLIALLLVGLFALRGGLSFAETYLLRATGGRMLRALRMRMHGHLLALGPGFYQDRPLGELLSRIGSDLERIQGTLTARGPGGARAAITFVGAVVILVSIHPQIALLALAMAPVVAGLALFYGRRLQALATRSQDAKAEVTAGAEESLAGLRTIQSLSAEASERDRYGRRLDRLLGVELETAHAVGRFSGLLQFVGYSAFALVVWYGGRLIAGGHGLSPGDLTASLIYTFAITGSIGPLGSLYAGLRELRGASARVYEIYNERPAIGDAPGAMPLAIDRGELRVESVCFGYPGSERPALDEVSLTVDPGEVVALVGPSGAGKSTLFALLQRFYDPQRGAIRIDGRDLRDATLASVRQSVAIVPQDVFLFSRSIADNIRVGRPDATDDEVREAAVRAGADGFIEDLPGGYGALVGERGVKLSVGQRQRIAIARAIACRPALLLLDEATSALDPDSEELVQSSLTELAPGLTTLVIAHRLATARRADRIVVLDRGRLVASGTHAELLEQSPLYRRYWNLQAPRDARETRPAYEVTR